MLLAAPAPDALTAVDRLQALVSSTDGFELAERDLELRREGDVLGADRKIGRASFNDEAPDCAAPRTSPSRRSSRSRSASSKPSVEDTRAWSLRSEERR